MAAPATLDDYLRSIQVDPSTLSEDAMRRATINVKPEYDRVHPLANDPKPGKFVSEVGGNPASIDYKKLPWERRVTTGEDGPIVRLWAPDHPGDAQATDTSNQLLDKIEAVKGILKRHAFAEIDIMPALPNDQYDPRQRGYDYEIFAHLPSVNGVPIETSEVLNEIEEVTGLEGSLNRPFNEAWERNLHAGKHGLTIAHSTERGMDKPA